MRGGGIRTSLRVFVGCLCFAALGVGCANVGAPEREGPSGTLKVFDGDEARFRAEIQPYLSASFPNLQVELLPFEAFVQQRRNGGAAETDALYNEFMERYNPDVIVARDASSFRTLLENQWLMPLDRVMEESEYIPDPIDPRLLEALEAEDGLQYALAPTFSSRAIFYNRERFEQAGAPFPTDGMTWEEVLRLATLLASPEADADGAIRYGLYHESSDRPYGVIVDVAARSGGHYVDDAGEAMTIRTPAWREAWTAVTEAYRAGAIYRASPDEAANDPFALFADGSIAMMTGNESTAVRLAATDALWGMATEPVDPRRPEIGASLHFTLYASVNQRSERPEAAWNVVRWLGLENAARDGTGIPVEREAYKRKFGDLDLGALYRLEPDREVAAQGAAVPSSDFYFEMFVEGSRWSESVIAGEAAVEQALEALEAVGGPFLLRRD